MIDHMHFHTICHMWRKENPQPHSWIMARTSCFRKSSCTLWSAERCENQATGCLTHIHICEKGLNKVSMSLICSELIEITGGNVRWCKYRFGGARLFQHARGSITADGKQIYLSIVKDTIWLFNIAMEISTMLLIGKPFINGPSIPWLC